MTNSIIVTREAGIRKMHCFVFYFMDGVLWLDKFTESELPTERSKKWVDVKKYDRINRRDNTIQEDDVPLTDEIRNEARNKFTNSITIKRWSERGK